MGILINKNSRIIVQGFTGNEGTFHSKEMIKYGSNIVGGITPYKGGIHHIGLPVFNDVQDAVKNVQPDVSVIFVPPQFAYDSIIESINYAIKLVIVITEGIPVKDMILIKSYLKNKNTNLIGPNCPGIITVNEAKIGIMPNSIFNKRGNIGIISRSGTLTYEVAYQIIQNGFGISSAIGIGGDPIIGMSIIDLLKLFENDIDTESIIIIGEIGGDMEIKAAQWAYNNNFSKKIFAFIAGQTAPKGRCMGHAGAIINNTEETAKSKMKIMNDYNINIIQSIVDIGKSIARNVKI
ncbi:MAG: succinate--CoA ligase subunit alpha [Bacteroides sp.]|nr:MAG: succinate--CoA ligase subunit alpha [Bacteroides sp.]